VAGALQLFHFFAYGNPLGFTPGQAATTFLYNNEQRDVATGLYNFRARPYDPRVGLLLGLDPFGGDPYSPQSFHKHAFAHGDPIQGRDPTGQFFSIAGIFSSMSIQSSLRGIHNQVLMNGAGAGFSAFMAGRAGEDPFAAFTESFRDGMRDSAIGAIPIIGTIYDVAQLLGTVGQLLSDYFGWEILGQIADAAESVSSSIGNPFGSVAAFMRSGSGASSSAMRIARIVADKADEVFQFVRSRNIDAIHGRNAARFAWPHSGAGDTRRYGAFSGIPATSRNAEGIYAEAHHLNQNAAFEPLGIAKRDGIAIPAVGDIHSPGTPHYEFHYSMDSFWALYRDGGILEGSRPTLRQYDQALRQALKHGGYSNAEARRLADLARQDWAHLAPDTRFPHIPNPTIRGNHGWKVH
jgi:RHS repeat-associated protein